MDVFHLKSDYFLSKSLLYFLGLQKNRLIENFFEYGQYGPGLQAV